MILVDTALAKRQQENKPIKVAIVGAGFMGKAVAFQICKHVQGMRLVAISNRHIEKARLSYANADINDVHEVSSVSQLESNIRAGKYSITDNAMLLCDAEGIDAIIEITGTVEFGANVALRTIKNKKHIILVNVDMDSTVGSILKVYADNAGVIFANSEGDQPGVIMNLYRHVRSLGIKPVMCGNLKGLHDPYRNPTTQEGFAKQWGQNPVLVTSAADGSKISFEQAVVANATGMRVAKRGMYGPTVPPGKTIKEALNLFPLEDMLEGAGIVDYITGISEPAPGVFVLGTQDHPFQKHFLKYYKLGEGPLYLFYTPYHLCHLEIPYSAARAVLFHDATITPIGRPYVDVVATAKTDLKAGQTLDGVGRYTLYGLCENSDTTYRENLLPIGIAEGCILKNDISKDQVLTYDDIILPGGRLVDKLRKEQDEHFKLEELYNTKQEVKVS